MKNLYCFTVVLLLAVFVGAQTETVLNGAGATVIEVISTNVAGLPVTEVLQTIVGSSTSATLTTTRLTSLTTSNPLTQTTALAVTTTSQIGPVGQPATTPAVAGGETPYTYTTTDANGDQVVMQGVFTPTGPQTVLPVPTTTGSILGYSQWLSIIGTNTAPANAAHRTSTSLTTGWYYFAATTFAGLIGGAWLII